MKVHFLVQSTDRLLAMQRARVDAAATVTVANIRRDPGTEGIATAKIGIDRSSLSAQVCENVSLDSKPGAPTVLTNTEGLAVTNLLVYAGSCCLSIGKAEVVKGARNVCNDGRKVPWKRHEASGQQGNC